MRILLEASGSLVSAFMIKAVNSAGHQAVSSDIDPYCVGRFLSDDFLQMPRCLDPNLWQKVRTLLLTSNIDLVIPSFDETLLGWSDFSTLQDTDYSTQVVLSPQTVITTFTDKLQAYQFFKDNSIPTPNTSLKQDFCLVKPRFGRGGKGVMITNDLVDMNGLISQEVIHGDEYTVDVLCDYDSNPIYIVPRKRLNVCDGKSTQGIVVRHPEIDRIVRKLCSITRFRGPINIQCFCDKNDNIFVIEVNPRISGGMALAFAATENWIPHIVAMAHGSTDFNTVPVKFGIKMLRYYSEVFV